MFTKVYQDESLETSIGVSVVFVFQITDSNDQIIQTKMDSLYRMFGVVNLVNCLQSE